MDILFTDQLLNVRLKVKEYYGKKFELFIAYFGSESYDLFAETAHFGCLLYELDTNF